MNKISFKEHQIIGLIAKMLNIKLTATECDIFNNAKNKVQGRRLSKHWAEANKHLSGFKNHMEEIMFIDYPKSATVKIYYGDRPQDGKIIQAILKMIGEFEDD